MSNESPQTERYVFPSDAQDAQITFTITVQEVSGEGLLLGATLEPGGLVFPHDHLATVFDRAPFTFVPGRYVMRTRANGTEMISRPDGVDKHMRKAIVDRFRAEFEQGRAALVTAIESFPSAEVIRKIAQDIVWLFTVSSLKRRKFSGEPVEDARLIPIQGVRCASCSLGLAFGLQKILEDMLGGSDADGNVRTLEGVRFTLDDDESPTVKIGYLTHENPFAPLLNNELASRVHEAIEQIASVVILDVIAHSRVHQRFFARNDASMLAAYDIDPVALEARVDALEDEAFAALAGTDLADDEEECDEDDHG